MSFLSSGYAYGDAYRRPVAEPKQELFIVNKGSIYSMLSDKFSVFKAVVDKSVLYRELLNRMELPITVFIAPDEFLPEQVKKSLLSLDRADATVLMSYHTIEGAVKLFDGHIAQTRHGGILLARIGNVIMLPKRESEQQIGLLNEGNFFSNGIVYVIDQPIIQGAQSN
jgi:hypothetical protein